MEVDTNNNGSGPPEIDEDLHSRQLAVYERETRRKLFVLNVLVYGRVAYPSLSVILRGPKNAREAVRHFGPAPVVPHRAKDLGLVLDIDYIQELRPVPVCHPRGLVIVNRIIYKRWEGLTADERITTEPEKKEQMQELHGK